MKKNVKVTCKIKKKKTTGETKNFNDTLCITPNKKKNSDGRKHLQKQSENQEKCKTQNITTGKTVIDFLNEQVYNVHRKNVFM